METISILGPIESLSLTDPEMTLQFWHRINFVIGLASETDRIFEALQEQAIEQIPNSYEPNALKSCGEQAFDYLMSALDEVEGRSDSCLLIPSRSQADWIRNCQGEHSSGSASANIRLSALLILFRKPRFLIPAYSL